MSKKKIRRRASKKIPKAKRVITPRKHVVSEREVSQVVPPSKPEGKDIRWVMRRFVPLTTTVMGMGYILPNIATIMVLGYILSTTRLSSLQMITHISGIILFLMASLVMMALGIAIMIGGHRYNKRNPLPSEMIFLGVIFASFYLLCLGAGSALLLSKIDLNAGLLILAPILIMVSAAVYMMPSSASRPIGQVLGIVGGLLLAIVTFNVPILGIAVAWGVPFPGPFMSMAILEGVAMILGSVAVAIYSIFSGRSEKPVAYMFFSIVGLIYGVGVFIGPMILSFSFLDLVWKAPWLGPLHELPSWVINTTVFWSASLVLLEIGGVLLILSSCLGFMFATKEFSRIHATLNEVKPSEVMEPSPKRKGVPLKVK